jgi:hypothetical protein
MLVIYLFRTTRNYKDDIRGVKYTILARENRCDPTKTINTEIEAPLLSLRLIEHDVLHHLGLELGLRFWPKSRDQ